MKTPERLSAASWTAFELRTDNREACFESLCKTLIRLSCEGAGEYVAYKNQAGIECYLRLKRAVPHVGDAGDCIGWQCKYFKLNERGALTTGQFKQIADSYAKTLRHYPQVTRWIVWTPVSLPERDRVRISNLRKRSHTIREIRFWDGETIEALMSVIPRNHLWESYFGQYALSDEDLRAGVDEALVPVRKRWLRDVHSVSSAEREVRRFLFCPDEWRDLSEFVVEQRRLKECIPEGVFSDAEECCIVRWMDFIAQLDYDLRTGSLVDNIAAFDYSGFFKMRRVLRTKAAEARRERRMYAPTLQNLAGGITATGRWVDEIRQMLGVVVKGVRSRPGLGKTHLAISVASGHNAPEVGPGCLILAKDLAASASINDLVASIDIAGRHFENLDALLEALDFVGCRQARLVPLVIDGLNESENPNLWRSILAVMAQKICKRYSHVRAIVTYRSSNIFGWGAPQCSGDVDYETMCLPGEFSRVAVEIESEDNGEMIKRYFSAYKIKYTGISLPSLLYHPLLLRIFCEMTQKDGREVEVQRPVADFIELYRGWVNRVVEKIQGDQYLSRKYNRLDCEKAIARFACFLWNSNSRRICAEELDRDLGCAQCEWRCRWSHVLADEGLAMCFHSSLKEGRSELECLHDDLAGFLIARGVVDPFAEDGLRVDARKDFVGKVVEFNHPLAQDILKSVVLLINWQKQGLKFLELAKDISEEKLLLPCLMLAKDQGVDMLDSRILKSMSPTGRIRDLAFGPIIANASWGGARYNGCFLDRFLAGMTMADRDLTWGVWMYENRAWLKHFIDKIVSAATVTRDERSIRSLLLVLKWLCASVVEEIRDGAVRAVCALGECAPLQVFEIVEGALKENDPVVSEKMMAAGYGVAVYHANMRYQKISIGVIESFAEKVRRLLFVSSSKYVTANIGILDYAANLIQLVDPKGAAKLHVVYNPFKEVSGIDGKISGIAEWAYRTEWNFVNKDIPHLWGDRDYQTDTPKYRRVRKQIDQRIIDLGYVDSFRQIDKKIETQDRRRSFPGEERFTVRRFGYKYARVAYYEMKGVLDRRIRPWNRWHEIELDSTFPMPPSLLPVPLPMAMAKKGRSLRDWVRIGAIPEYGQFALHTRIGGDQAEWVLLNGYREETDVEGRRLLVLFNGLLVNDSTLQWIRSGARISPCHMPDSYYAFHGESGWSRQWMANEESRTVPTVRAITEMLDDGEGGECHWAERLSMHLIRESYHTVLNQDESGFMLSPALIQACDLRVVPHQWAYKNVADEVVAKYFQDKNSNRYGLIFLRGDVLESYCKMRHLHYIVHEYSERTIDYHYHNESEKIYKGLKQGCNEEVRVYFKD